MISTFNFLLYWIANYMIFIALTFMLTPRKSKFLSTVIVCAVVFVPTLYKVLHLGEQGQASAVIMHLKMLSLNANFTPTKSNVVVTTIMITAEACPCSPR